MEWKKRRRVKERESDSRVRKTRKDMRMGYKKLGREREREEAIV